MAPRFPGEEPVGGPFVRFGSSVERSQEKTLTEAWRGVSPPPKWVWEGAPGRAPRAVTVYPRKNPTKT